jgi:LPS-assembly protein
LPALGRALPALALAVAAVAVGVPDAGAQWHPIQPPELPEARPEAAAPGAETAPAEPRPDRITFRLPFPEDKGGGEAAGSADLLDFERDRQAVLTGDVEIRYQDIELHAQRVWVDLGTKVVTAEGDVILDQGPRRLAGRTLTFDLDTKTGTLTEASAHVTPDYYFRGTEVSKVGPDTYTVTDGVFTSCDGDSPEWSFRLGRARVDVEGYARVHNASMRVKKLPVFYTPYLLWPAKTERTSGLLIPNLGYSETRGSYVGLAYYQVLGRSYDTTFYLDHYGEGFAGVGNDFRYQPTEGTAGEARGYLIRDLDLDEDRWKLELDHVTDDLPYGMRGVVTLRRFSDFDFFRDFERNFDRVSQRFEESRGFVSGNWGPHLVNLQVTDRETFIGDTTTIDRRLPELEYRLRSTQIGSTPLVARLESSAAFLSVDRSETYRSDYGRVDLAPELSLPLRPAPWMSVAVSGGGRLTWYGDTLDETGSTFTGEQRTRSFPVAGAEIIGPSLARVFDGSLGGFGRFMHIVEPRFTYSYSGEVDDQQQIPSFDSIDRVGSANFGRVSLINRLKAKPKEESGSSLEIASFELARAYSFDSERPFESGDGRDSQAGPIEATLRVNPSQDFNLRATATYSGLFSQLLSTSLSSGVDFDRARFDLRWNSRYQGATGETLSDQLRFYTSLRILPDRLTLQASVDYDIEQSLLQEQRYFVDWVSQCYGIRFELRQLDLVDRQETDYRVAFTLKNVGTFLDLTGRYE